MVTCDACGGGGAACWFYNCVVLTIISRTKALTHHYNHDPEGLARDEGGG